MEGFCGDDCGGRMGVASGEVGGTVPPKCLVSFMCTVRALRETKLSLHQTHLNTSLFVSGPRLIHCDCQALWRPPRLGRLPPAPPVLAISLMRSRGFLASLLPAAAALSIDDVDISGGGDDEDVVKLLLAADTRLPKPGILARASGVKLPSRGPRKCGKPAAAAHWKGYFDAASSYLGIFDEGPSRNDPTWCLLLPDKSSGDSAELLSLLGEESGDRFERLRTSPGESSPEENFRFRESSDDVIECRPAD